MGRGQYLLHTRPATLHLSIDDLVEMDSHIEFECVLQPVTALLLPTSA